MVAPVSCKKANSTFVSEIFTRTGSGHARATPTKLCAKLREEGKLNIGVGNTIHSNQKPKELISKTREQRAPIVLTTVESVESEETAERTIGSLEISHGGCRSEDELRGDVGMTGKKWVP
ncbi:hypothetical protein J6590_043315 [Homalodisca vitripennis]|nr:hypothetical protein J6590_043315 [Homalodisca vitripennis]